MWGCDEGVMWKWVPGMEMGRDGGRGWRKGHELGTKRQIIRKFQKLCVRIGQRETMKQTKTNVVPVLVERCLLCWHLLPDGAPQQHIPLTHSILIWRSTFLFCELLHSTCKNTFQQAAMLLPRAIIRNKPPITEHLLGTVLCMMHSWNNLVSSFYLFYWDITNSVKCAELEHRDQWVLINAYTCVTYPTITLERLLMFLPI